MSQPTARARFSALLRSAIDHGSLEKLTLGKHRGADTSLKNIFVRPITLKSGPQLTFVYRHATHDITKNHPPAEALTLIDSLLGSAFLDAHLFTASESAQLSIDDLGTARISIKKSPASSSLATPSSTPKSATHDRARGHLVTPDSPWLRTLGVVNENGQPREGMSGKFRQINKFVELLSHLTDEAKLTVPAPAAPAPPLHIADMGCGKGYLTFATAAYFGPRATVLGIESRPELVALCNRLAVESRFPQLSFQAGHIDSTPLTALDVLIALHACDTATDDAIAKGIAAGARLIVVSPCCQKELRPQLTAPAVLTDALRHGIFQERQAEFITDALRAQLLEWAGYRTKVFEFIATEHTAKNLMIAAIKVRPTGTEADAANLRAFANFYGIREQRLARHLGLSLIA